MTTSAVMSMVIISPMIFRRNALTVHAVSIELTAADMFHVPHVFFTKQYVLGPGWGSSILGTGSHCSVIAREHGSKAVVISAKMTNNLNAFKRDMLQGYKASIEIPPHSYQSSIN